MTLNFTLIAKAVIRDRLLLALLLVGVVMSFWLTPSAESYVHAINWPTITTLSGLLVLARGLETSGLLNHLASKLMILLHRERTLAIFLVLAAALLSMLLTNDIALFVVVPLTLGLRQLAVIPVSRLIIFEALAVNAGSMLSPIGNPQNILLWQQSGLGFIDFTKQMLPLSFIILIALLILTILRFPSKIIELQSAQDNQKVNRPLARLCAALFVLFVVAVEYKYAALGLLVVLSVLLWRARKLVLQADWLLILVFILMFIDIGLIARLTWFDENLSVLAQQSPRVQLWVAALISQFISNVPATILLLQYTPATEAIAFGVNVAGFGLALGSMANLIALRMSDDKTIWWSFHFYSILMFMISMLAASVFCL